VGEAQWENDQWYQDLSHIRAAFSVMSQGQRKTREFCWAPAWLIELVSCPKCGGHTSMENLSKSTKTPVLWMHPRSQPNTPSKGCDKRRDKIGFL